MTKTATLVLVLVTAPLFAQVGGVAYEKVLLPLTAAAPTPGRQDSRWLTSVTLVNHAAGPVSLLPYNPGFGCTCPLPPLPPNVTLTFDTPPFDPTSPGGYLYIDRANINAVEINIRVQDVSRQIETWGAAIPVVRESSFRADTFSLLDVPLDPTVRHTLRIYTQDPTKPGRVRISIFATDPKNTRLLDAVRDRLLGTQTVDLAATEASGSTNQFLTRPGYAELNDLRAIGDISGAQRLRIDLLPLTTDQRIWAFLTVTNNITQEIAVISPKS